MSDNAAVPSKELFNERATLQLGDLEASVREQRELVMTKKLSICLLLLLSACGKTEFSEQMQEPATVEDLIYLPSQHGSGVSPGMTSSGKMTMSFTSVDIPQKYAVVFRCAHGKFIIEGEGQRYRDLWSRLQKGQRVQVIYREQYWVTDKERSLQKLDFIDALPGDVE